MSRATFGDILSGKTKRKKVESESVVTLPVKGGRQSVADDSTTIGSLLAELSVTTPDFNIELLGALENLAKYNGDVSYAVENIVTLGNTVGKFPQNITFDDKIKDSVKKEMITRLKERSKDWYAYSGGMNSMINDLLVQTCITGALSAEMVVSSSLDGVKKVVMVAPKNIRFRYDKDKDEYSPFQQLRKSLGQDGSNLIPLNTVTYNYSAMRRFGEKPYAIPPFLSALEAISISRDMMANVKSVIKRLGVLGFLEVLVNAPKALPNEDPKKYYKRTQSYLDAVVPEIEKGLNKGYVTGFKNMHEFKMHGVAGSNVNGSKDLIELNDTKLMAGLKQDPLMFGRNFSTTETLGRVILAKMTTQVTNYQQLIENFLEKLFLLDLQLAGFPVKNIEVDFEKPMIGDKQREEETKTKKIDNARALYNDGLISQQQRATMLGFEKPDQKEPRQTGIVPHEHGDGGDDKKKKDPDKPKKTDPAKDDDATDEKTTGANHKATAYLSLGGGLPVYPYSDENCSCENHEFSSTTDSILQNFIDQYYDATKGTYDKAVVKMTQLIGKRLSELGAGAGHTEIADAVLGTLYTKWGTTFNKSQSKVVDKFIDTIYGFYRKDKSVFGSAGDIPKGTFNTTDARAMAYYKQSDKLYLGKFVTDADLNTKITQFIKDNYLDDDMPIGNNAKAIKMFKEKFGDIMQGQDWKITRIINTTANRMRNTASVSYMNQAEVEEYEIRGVSDRLQCGYCHNLQGTKFQVSKTMDTLNSLNSTEPALVGADSPFVTSIFKKPEDMAELSGAELQNLGINAPPFHSNCRDTIVAIL